MSDEYQKALFRRAELTQELEKLDSFLTLWREIFGEPEKNDPSAEKIAPEVGRDDAAEEIISKGGPVRPEGYAKPAEVIRAAVEILAERGRPMTRRELLGAMEARGMVMGGADKTKSLGTTLWRAKDQIVSIEDAGYWLKDKPCAFAGYHPAGLSAAQALGFKNLM